MNQKSLSFHFCGGKLNCEKVTVEEIHSALGSAFYLYSSASFFWRLNKIRSAFKPLNAEVFYSVKSCNNINILKFLANEGASFDVVSGAELFKVQRACRDISQPNPRIVFAGVGKTSEEVLLALKTPGATINCESEAELARIIEIAEANNLYANVAIRVNPDIYDPLTHQKTATGGKTTKFGIAINEIIPVLLRARKSDQLNVCGLHVHLGSPLFSTIPYLEAIAKLKALMKELKEVGINITTLNIGGGFPIFYYDKFVPEIDFFSEPICAALEGLCKTGIKIFIEPGRYISAQSGILITRVEYVKNVNGRKTLITDNGMNALLRPSLYDAEHFIWPVKEDDYSGNWESLALDINQEIGTPNYQTTDVVGPNCETGDILASNRLLPSDIKEGDLLAVFCTGAYGTVMASRYNARPLLPEVLVDGAQWKVIRRPETLEDTIAHELLSP